MPAPIDIAISQKLQQIQLQSQPATLQSQTPSSQTLPSSSSSQPSIYYDTTPRESALDLLDLTPSLSIDSGHNSDDDSYPHNLEAAFCRDFSCCGLVLRDLHDLLQHYEECHARLEEDSAKMSYMDEWSSHGFDGSGRASPQDMMMNRHDEDHLAMLKRQQMAAAAAVLSNGVNLSDVYNPNTSHMVTDAETVQTLEASLLLGGGRKRTATGMMEGTFTLDDAMLPNKRPMTGVAQQSLPQQQHTFIDDELLLAAMLQLNGEDALNEFLLLQQQLFLQHQQPQDYLPSSPSLSVASSSSSSPVASSSTACPPPSIAPVISMDTIPTPLHTLSQPLLSSPSIPGMSALTNSAVATPVANAPLNTSKSSATASTNGSPRTASVERPYRCSVPGCEKSYKNANGLKYHNIHGHCTGAAAANTRTNVQCGQDKDGSTLGMHDPERARPKPYRCTIPECGKSYKNLNGLKYHVEHAHPGAIALPLGKKAHVKAAASVIAQAQARLQMSDIKAVVVPANLVPSLNLSGESPATDDTTIANEQQQTIAAATLHTFC